MQTPKQFTSLEDREALEFLEREIPAQPVHSFTRAQLLRFARFVRLQQVRAIRADLEAAKAATDWPFEALADASLERIEQHLR